MTAIEMFQERLYQVLKEKIEPIKEPHRDLSIEQSTLFAAVEILANQLIEDAALDMAQDAMDSVCAILLTIYEQGNYPGEAANKNLDRLAKLLLKAREDERRSTGKAVEAGVRNG